jgi:hypothetical protein
MTNAASKFQDACAKKAFEIGYALVRLAGHTRPASFAGHLERQAFEILEKATRGKYRELQNALAGTEYFIRLGREGNLIAASHADVLYEEIARFYGSLEDREVLPETEVSLDGIFTPFEHRSGNPAPRQSPRTFTNPAHASSSDKPSISADVRQSLILDKIRQSGTCRLRDLQDILPDASERTIRYDIQELITRGHLERVGAGGPATAYRLKESAPADLLLGSGEAGVTFS